MLRKVRRLRGALVDLLVMPDSVHAIESARNAHHLSPIDRYLMSSYRQNRKAEGLFEPFFEFYIAARITKILAIYGLDFFPGKKVLELGAGLGDVGAVFAELGAEVLCLEGRVENVNFGTLKHRALKNITFKQFNLEEDFREFGRFDLIIHMGLLYHLRNVEDSLKCCFSMADELILETRVCDSTDPQAIFLVNERQELTHLALEGVGSRPSPFYIERIAEENGFEVIRHFTKDLNCARPLQDPPEFNYTWEHKNDNDLGTFTGYRRFWRFKKGDKLVEEGVVR